MQIHLTWKGSSPGRRFGGAVRILHYDSLPSTMDAARALALDGEPEGTVVRARRQTAGRGRDGRAWASPEGGLYLSVVLRPRAPPARWTLLPLAAGCAVGAAVRALGRPAALKWPNDVLVDGRKVAGVLVEARAPEFAVVGVGLNAAIRVPPELGGIASSLDLDPEATEGLAAVLAAGIAARAARLDDVVAEWRGMSATLGGPWDAHGVKGLAVDVDADGALLVETPQGTRRVTTPS